MKFSLLLQCCQVWEMYTSWKRYDHKHSGLHSVTLTVAVRIIYVYEQMTGILWPENILMTWKTTDCIYCLNLYTPSFQTLHKFITPNFSKGDDLLSLWSVHTMPWSLSQFRRYLYVQLKPSSRQTRPRWGLHTSMGIISLCWMCTTLLNRVSSHGLLFPHVYTHVRSRNPWLPSKGLALHDNGNFCRGPSALVSSSISTVLLYVTRGNLTLLVGYM